MCAVDFPAGKWDPFMNVDTVEDLTAARLLAPPPKGGMA